MSSNINKKTEMHDMIRTRVLRLASRKTPWAGTMTDLLVKLSGRKMPESFPKNGSALRRVIDKLVPQIKNAGFNTEFSRTTDSNRMRIVRFTPIGKSSK